MKAFFNDLFKSEGKAPHHYASKYINDKNPFGDKNYGSYSNMKEIDEEYQQRQKNKSKLNSCLEITSKSLKYEYTKKLNYLTKYLRLVFILSIIIIVESLLRLKFSGYSELNISMVILCSLSITITLLLLFNIKTNVLLDLYGYSSFYLFSIFESSILISIYILKIISFFNLIYNFIYKDNCKGQNTFFCSKRKSYYFNIFFNILIFVGIYFVFNFTILSFYESFCVLVLKKKTTVQKQKEINDKGLGEGERIEFIETNDKNDISSRNLNGSDVNLDSLDNLKNE